ncbi:MAG: hypothetical protein AW07_02548 [Candidatus Accumulibacter sp. SK-11]|nr:MAG: hypothetical protein AW07_02548 [Candidatus Accumulibacter sp. SK-11]
MAQCSQLLRLHQMIHRLAQFGGTFGHQFLELLPVALEFRLCPLAIGHVEVGTDRTQRAAGAALTGKEGLRTRDDPADLAVADDPVRDVVHPVARRIMSPLDGCRDPRAVVVMDAGEKRR